MNNDNPLINVLIESDWDNWIVYLKRDKPRDTLDDSFLLFMLQMDNRFNELRKENAELKVQLRKVNPPRCSDCGAELGMPPHYCSSTEDVWLQTR
jgi:hypothetical protein